MTDLKQLEQDMRTGRISRRDFVKLTALFGLTAAAPGAVFGGSHGGPKRGGHIKFGLGHGSTTDSADPATYENGFVAPMGNAIHNYLTQVRVDGLKPQLAESWEASADAKTWTLQLRKDVEFHNGQKMKASDVMASLNYHRGEDSKSGAKVIADTITEMKADGDHVLAITLKEGNADFPYLMSDYHLAIMPADGDGKVDGKSGIGCGSYTLKSYEPGVRAELARFDNHWNDEAGFFDTVEMLTIADVAARTNALTTGEVDVIDRLDVKTMHLLARDKKIRIMETEGNAHYSIPMRCDTDPFSNNDVRLALKYCLDREAIMQNVLRGHGYLGNDHPIGKASPYYAADLPQRAYDPEKARHHLKKAKMEGLKVQLSAADAAFAGAVDAAVMIKEHAAKAGIDIEVVREPNDGYWSNVWMKKPWGMCYWGGRPTEDWMFSTAYSDGAKWNDSFWKHDKFNKLLLEARAELDTTKRGEMYHEMQQIVSDEGGVPIPVFNNWLFACNKEKVGTPEKLAGNWALDGYNAMTLWWLNS